MADDKKVIFSMVGVSKLYPPQKKVLNDIYINNDKKINKKWKQKFQI